MILVDLDLGHKIPATLPLVILEHVLVLKGEVEIGLIPATLTTTTHVAVIDC